MAQPQSRQNNQTPHSRILLSYKTSMRHKDQSRNYRTIINGSSITTQRNYSGITTITIRNYRRAA